MRHEPGNPAKNVTRTAVQAVNKKLAVVLVKSRTMKFREKPVTRRDLQTQANLFWCQAQSEQGIERDRCTDLATVYDALAAMLFDDAGVPQSTPIDEAVERYIAA